MIRWLAWRLHRRALLGFGIGGFLVSLLYGFAFRAAAGTSAESQAAFGAAVTVAARQFTFLIPLPVHPETLGGYEQYKWLAGATIMLAVWAALAGAGAGRGDEERGLTEQWLAGGFSRRRLYLLRGAAFALTLLAVCVASVAGMCIVAPAVGQDANVAGAALKAVSMAAGLLCCYSLALLISQLPAERQTATALGVGAVVALLFDNGVADTVEGWAGLGVVSPFHWMERTTSLAPGGSFDLEATLVTLLSAAIIGLAAIPLFERRDVGAGLLRGRRGTRPPVRAASRNPLLRLPFSAGIWEQRVGLTAWIGGTALLAAVMLSVTRSVGDALFADPRLAAVFAARSSDQLYSSLLGLMWFGSALLLLAGYAVVQVSRWSGQDQEGRVELVLSHPLSRGRLVAERALEFALASLLIVLGGYLGLAATAPGSGLHLDAARLLAASALLWPFALAFGGLGVAIAGRWPRVAVPLLTAFAGVEYFLGDLAPLFRFPSWVADLSVFHLYGNPLADGFAAGPPLSLLLVFLAGFSAALFLARRRDVGGAG